MFQTTQIYSKIPPNDLVWRQVISDGTMWFFTSSKSAAELKILGALFGGSNQMWNILDLIITIPKPNQIFQWFA